MRGTLTGDNHAPVVNKVWRYSLTVTDASGRPLSGTVHIEFVSAGQWWDATGRRPTLSRMAAGMTRSSSPPPQSASA